MTDWTPDEINSRKKLKILSDNQKIIQSSPQLTKVGSTPPSSLDWRNNGVITSIKNQ
jgi:hypothetical protein